MFKRVIEAWKLLYKDLNTYKPDQKALMLRIGLWITWSMFCHYTWLHIWYLYPITAMLTSPILYWQLRALVEDTYLMVLLSTKVLFEMTAAQIGSGYAMQNSLMNSIEEGIRSQRFHVTVEPILKRMTLKLKLGVVTDDFYNELIDHTKIEGLKTLSILTEASIKTGSSLDQLMIYYGNLLGEQLKQRGKFKEILSQKRNEFNVMQIMPVCGMLAIQNLIPEYYSELTRTGSGLMLLVMTTAIYGFSTHLFYRNEGAFSKFLSTW